MNIKLVSGIAKISGAVCAIFSFLIVIMSMSVFSTDKIALIVLFLLPIAACALHYLRNAMLKFVSGAISIGVGAFAVINQIITTLSAGLTGWMPYVVFVFGLICIEGGVFTILWYKGLRQGESTFAEFEILSADAGDEDKDGQQ